MSYKLAGLVCFVIGCGGKTTDSGYPESNNEDENTGTGIDDSGSGGADDGGSGSGETGGDAGSGDEGSGDAGSGDAGSGDAGSGDAGDDGGSSAFFPQEGKWNITGATTEVDTCECEDLDDGSGDGSASFTVEAISETAFALSITGGEPLACELTDQAFVCDTSDEATPVDDFDITIHTSTVISGTFASETSLTGTFDIGVSCSGSDCGWVSWVCDGTMPCEVLSSFDASAG